LQPLFAESRTGSLPALTGIFGASARCIPGIRRAKAQGWKNAAIPIIAGLGRTTWVTSNIGVTHVFYSKRWREEKGETVKAIPSRKKHSNVAETVP